MKKLNLFIISFLLLSVTGQAVVRMPHIYGDNMVIQRDKPVKIWGWADKGEKVTVSFLEQTKTVKADRSGNWSVTLQPVAYGGPYTLTVKGKNEITFNNVLVGDVWLCSGQSNMEMPVNGGLKVYDYEQEIADANYPEIRHFQVEKNMSEKPLDDVTGSWQVCSPETVSAFTAVGYFFARKLYRELGIPVGLVNSSWGGTDIETWTSAGTFDQLPQLFRDRYKNTVIAGVQGEVQPLKNAINNDMANFMKENNAKRARFLEAIKNDRGLAEKWFLPETNTADWKKMELPQLWENTLGQSIDGIIWFTYSLNLPADIAGKEGVLNLGTIDDEDVTYINGQKIGETAGYSLNRNYKIPANVLKSGVNTITVKVYDSGGGGGLWGNPEDMYLLSGDKKYSLSGNWSYKPSVTNAEFGWVNITPNMYYSLLYNAMIHPIIQFPIKGAIWYQGENNASQAYNYRTLFSTLIKDWRAKWGYEFPFYWVQLANFMAKDKEPTESNWAALREAQTMTLSLPQTGQAVITDIGDAADIHPRNKQDVGLRLALIALNRTYGEQNVIYSGPTFKSMERKGNQLVISFDNIGGGLVSSSKYGYVEGFAVAGADKKFYWARAYIDGDKVIVTSDKVVEPVAVRYSWSDNPDVNLFNTAGLPAVPFRTDE
jgi:sialate O-acetylesterase